MGYTVEVRQTPEQPIRVVSGRTTRATITADIRKLFDQFYSGFKSNGELNIIYYPQCGDGEFEIQCGVQVASGGNSATPAGEVASTTYFGPYDRMDPAHAAIHQWVRENGRKFAGPSWEVYGHWSEDPAKLRTDIFYLLGV